MARGVMPRRDAVGRSITSVNQFRNVLERMAAPEPEPGRPFTAGLTHLEVEARGVFTATAPTEENPTGTIGLLPVDAAAVQPEALSTVRMRFSLVPNLTTGGAGGGPAPGA